MKCFTHIEKIVHIIPSNRQEKIDDEVRKYLIELQEKGFVVDSIENMKCQPRDWHTVHSIMDLIGRYDREKAKRIIDIVDVSRLAERARNSWGQSHEITELCDILYIGSYNVARRFIKSNLDKIQTMYHHL